MAMTYGAEAMRRPVEIEFAVNLNDDRTGELYLLQIRPIVDSKQMLDEDLTTIPDDQCLLRSHNSLGHGVSDDVQDVVYVKTDSSFTASNNPTIADEIERINRKFLDTDKNYVPHWSWTLGVQATLGWGIPVKWPHISAARVIVEEGVGTLSCRPKSGNTFLPKSHLFRCRLFHN